MARQKMEVHIENKIPELILQIAANRLELLKRGAVSMQSQIQARAPVLTGALRDSISQLVDSDTQAVVYSACPYSRVVEVGGPHNRATHYFTEGGRGAAEEIGTIAMEVFRSLNA